MRQQFIFCIIVLLFVACNNSSSTEKISGDSIAIAKYDTSNIVDIIEPAADPIALTAAEMKDDSAFADGSIPSSWTNAGFSDSIAVKKFLKKIKYWVGNNQKDSVAAIIAYPLRKPVIKNQESLLKNYESVFNDKVKKALLEQNLSQLFRNAQGVMVGNGDLWINETPRGLKIIAINN
jgi:hypothetical protein